MLLFTKRVSFFGVNDLVRMLLIALIELMFDRKKGKLDSSGRKQKEALEIKDVEGAHGIWFDFLHDILLIFFQ